MAEAYPLHWPFGRQRTQRPERSRFDTTAHLARVCLFEELGRLGAESIILSTNVELRLDGMPYANRREPDDKGVAVYFNRNGKGLVFSCDRWDKIKDNIQAIRKTIDALRGIERWGTGEEMEAAFTGFQALPPPTKKPWREVMGIPNDVTKFRDVRIKFIQLSRKRHPDSGGSDALMSELNVAHEDAERELTS